MARTTTTNARLASLAALAGLACAANAQMFHHVDGSNSNERPYDIVETRDGGYVTAGSILDENPFAGPNQDFYIVKHDALGNVQWWTKYGGQLDDVAYSVKQTQDGGYIVAGHSDSTDANYQLALLRLDAGGNPIWAESYRGDAFGELLNPAEPEYFPQPAVIETFDGDFVAVSNVRTSNGLQRGVLLRTDPAGGVIYSHEFGDAASPNLTFLTFTDLHELTPEDLDGDGIPDRADIAVTGYTTTLVDPTGGAPFLGGQDVFAMRTTPGGIPVWANQYTVTPSPQNFNNEEGYGIDSLCLPDMDLIAIGVYFENSDAIPGTQHYWLDAAGGAVLSNHLMFGMIPSFAATRWENEGDVVTAGQDVGLPPTAHGTSAALRVDPGLGGGAGLKWVGTYTDPNTNFRDRFQGVAVPLPDAAGNVQCGVAFTTAERVENGIGGLDNYMVKVNDFGETACLFTLVQAEETIPEPNRFPRQLEFIRDFEQIQWGTTKDNGQQDFAICRDLDCRLCPIDFNGDGVLNNTDINLFVNLFLAMDPAADLNNDGFWNNADINIFVNLFVNGC